MRKNLNLLDKIMRPVNEKWIEHKCDVCSTSINDGSVGEIACDLLYKLNDSQVNAISTCLATVKCHHKASVERICGPPGTGKTRTLSVMLVMLLRMKCRTVICAPTDVVTARVASELVKLVRESSKNEFDGFCPLGDILLFVNKDSLDGGDITEISLDYRVERLVECFTPADGWNHRISSMINFLEALGEQEEAPKIEAKVNSLVDFSRSGFCSTTSSLRRCMLTICTHVPVQFLREENVERTVRALSLLDSLEGMLFQHSSLSSQCLVLLKDLQQSLRTLNFPSATSKDQITEFCIRMASSVFCTASTSYKLHSVDIKPFDLLVVDDSTQMKECEAVIPLQLRGLRHVILTGDECQQLETVKSRISREARFGRSLFERLGSLGHAKHLLNVQYRMHPSICKFPNPIFYRKQILDAPDVKLDAYEKRYLKGHCFGSYAFINVPWGEEQLDNLGHRRNLVEVALVMQILQRLFKAWNTSEKKLSVGVISPYAAQVFAIQDRLGRRYNNHPLFEVNVKTIDGFHGGEEDIVIISTVRSNRAGSIGFLSSHHWTNVALTRARHCLWILGNEQTLLDSNSIWEALVLDAKDRQCFFHADEDADMRKTILDVKKELDQLDDLLNEDSILFKEQRWKVVFSDNFRKSFQKLASSCLRKYVLTLLVKLASGWRPKRKNVDLVCESSSQVVKQFKVVEGCYIVCTIDIQKELIYTQVLKVWDILPLEEVPGFLRRLDEIYLMYTNEFIGLCKEKYFEGDLDVPKSWEIPRAVVQYKKDTESKLNRHSNGAPYDSGYVEHSRVNESLLLMKFYSLSSGVVNHLLSDRHGEEVDIPFEVTNEEREIILFDKSSFILGRSGTGKTTVLTMKLYQKEQQHHSSVQGLGIAEGNEVSQYEEETGIRSYTQNKESLYIGETSRTTLRQLFVTVSPKLCYAVNKQVSQLKSFALGGSFWAESSFDTDDLDGMMQFRDVPNSFIGIPYRKYPLVITFHKFLIMLDGTVGSSYFDRFSLKWKLSKDKSLRTIALETLVREKEINYDRFCCLYWPRFRSELTKNLDPSRVFTEIISHIKGGLQAGGFHDGKLTRDAYVSMSEYRVSNLSTEMRAGIYDVFLDYEKMKMTRGEFDVSDLVNDLHLRLRCDHLDGDKMDFVYIDEVQDLTMRQLALFKYICRNVDEGFVFSGDTAQTIARGVDFRFEDIRSLFYTEFVMESKGEARRKDKGHLSDVFQLLQNFRTHTGVLRLAQSVIDLLSHYFPQSVDVLKPETSLIDGAAPLLLKPGDDENAIVTIFGNKGNNSGKIVGFGAEQVILVRDESAKQEVSCYIGQKALILTIIECKGPEFEDVLLYNFFSSSPLGNQWRVIYEFMKERSLADFSFPSFCNARHNILCSELKQLYVAITRTRQRLWISESVDEFSRPMFDYWRMLSLVEVKEVDASIADAMQTFSTPEEWKSRGMKLFSEKNYEMAMMCFKQAGEVDWEKRAKAAGIVAAAERIRYSDPGKARTYLLEAAEIFYSIGRFKSAAECFYDLKDYKQAGNIFLDKCGELIMAAECFLLAGRYKRAAEVYAKGNYFTECLSACTKGKCYDLGLKYIENWKQHAAVEIDEIGKEFLESCAYNYFVHKDGESMMKFVKAFPTMDMKRRFLMSRKCLDELLVLEEESGNYTEAAEIARMNGNILCEADLAGKGGDFDKACSLILLYVLSRSLWMDGSKGWPLKSFLQKEELLKKAMTYVEHGSNSETTCIEIKVLLNESGDDWSHLKHILDASKKCKSFLGEILCCRKILDFHFQNDVMEYVWDDKLPIDLQGSEELISCCPVSIGTLLHFWSSWTKNVFDVLDSLGCLGDEDFGEFKGIGEFVLKYFGVRQQLNGLNVTYVLLHPAAEWVKNIQNFVIRQNKQIVFVEPRHFISAAQTHWHTELLVVGLKVLETLESLYELAAKSMVPLFWQSKCLVNVYEISKFLLESKHHVLNSFESRVQNFLTLSRKYFEKVIPLDPRQSMVGSMISLRRTKLSRELLRECIVQDIGTSDLLSYGQIGRMVVIWLASGELPEELYEKIVGRMPSDVPWKPFIELLGSMKQKGCPEDFQPGDDSVGGKFSEFQEVLSSNSNLECSKESSSDAVVSMEITLLQKFCEALQESSFSANSKKIGDCLSPGCFLYLLERFLILVSQYRGIFFMIKSSFVEWLISEQFEARPTSMSEMKAPLLEEFYDNILVMIQYFIHNKASTVDWIARSRIYVDLYYKQMVLRLVLVLCLLCVNCEKYYDVLFNVLSIDNVKNQLPEELYAILQRVTENNYSQIDDFGEAFQKSGDPLLVVNCGEIVPGMEYSNVVSVELGTNCSREDILSLLFPAETRNEVVSDPSANFSSHCGDQSESSDMPLSAFTCVSDPRMNWSVFQEISDILNSCGINDSGTSASVSTINLKAEVNANVNFLTAAITLCSEKKFHVSEDMMEQTCNNMLQELIQLHSLMNTSTLEKESIEQLLKSLLSKKPKLEPFLNQFIVSRDIAVALESQLSEEQLDVTSDEVTTTDLLPSASNSETRGGNEAERKQGKGKGKFKKHKGSRKK